MSEITTGALYQEWKDINNKLLTQINKQDEIIAKQQSLIERLESPIDTRITGSNVEDLVVAREIRDARVISHLAAPDGAIGFRAELSVYGSTGTFEEGEGLRLLYWDRTEKRGAFVNTYNTKPTTGSENREQHVIIIHPSVINNDEEDNLLLSNMVIGKAVRLQIDITGEFEEGEGFDCELTVRWLF